MKINKYNYSCKECGKTYSEQRKESEPHYIQKCFICGGDFKLDKTIFIEDYIEPVVIIDEAPVTE
jgi:rRNA maturation endonuclease Nob1